MIWSPLLFSGPPLSFLSVLNSHSLCQHAFAETLDNLALLAPTIPSLSGCSLPQPASAPAGAGGAEVWEQLGASGLSIRGHEHSWRDGTSSPEWGAAAPGEQQPRQPRSWDIGRAPVTHKKKAHRSQSRAFGTSVTAEGVTQFETRNKAKWGGEGFCLFKTYHAL